MGRFANVVIEDKWWVRVLKDLEAELKGQKRAKFYRVFVDYMKKDIDTRFERRGVNESDQAGVWPDLATPNRARTRKGKGGKIVGAYVGNIGRENLDAGATQPGGYRKKRDRGKPILVNSGDIRNGVRVRPDVKKGEVILTCMKRYYFVHHHGADTTRNIKIPPERLSFKNRMFFPTGMVISARVKIPKRQLLLFTKRNMAFLDAAIIDWWEKKFKTKTKTG